MFSKGLSRKKIHYNLAVPSLEPLAQESGAIIAAYF
jgi:hypothetical protein